MQVTDVLFDDIQTGDNSYATIFRTADHKMFILHEDKDPITLFEVQRRMKLLGVKTRGVLSPLGDKTYFTNQGRQIFLQTYPGRTTATDEEKSFYESQSLYNPAIMLVANIPGDLKHYSPRTASWKVIDKYNFDFSGAKV